MEKLQIPEFESKEKNSIPEIIQKIIEGDIQVYVPIKNNGNIIGYKKIYKKEEINTKILDIYSKISELSKIKCDFLHDFKFIKAKKVEESIKILKEEIEKLKSYATYDIYKDEETGSIYNFEDLFKEYNYNSGNCQYEPVSLEVSSSDDISKGLKYIANSTLK